MKEALYKAEKGVMTSLTEKCAPAMERGGDPVKVSNGVFGGYESLIRSLRLFRGLSTASLDSLLRHAAIRDLGKGTLLFLEGEPANRLYIVLKGWIKVFKGTVNGDETILQMFGGGDAILEAEVFLNISLSVSGQVVEDATLLSIPAPLLKEHVKNNNELALNLLATMSRRSQDLIHQIENTRLKTAGERIGWFLLRQLLNQERTSRHVDLPYDKSLIASYLDMRPETFSRTLNYMKRKGFKIENRTVVIPDLGALCGFCDQDTANMCSLRDMSECPNPHCDGDDISTRRSENRTT